MTAVLDRAQRNAALGLRFWDLAGATAQVPGLEVRVGLRPPSPGLAPGPLPAMRRAEPTRSGAYVAHRVPGLAAFENQVATDAELWAPAPSSPPTPQALQACRVQVRDPLGRFLPLDFDADLPTRGWFSWLAPWLSPPQALPWPVPRPGVAGSPPEAMVQHVPLFSAPSRPVPATQAVLYAQLLDSGSRMPAAWTLLAVSIEGRRTGLGLSDAQGRVGVMFPYPEPPRQQLASPPEARDDFSWPLALQAFGTPPSPLGATVPDHADLATVMEQLNQPRAVIESLLSPSLPLRLDYRVPLTLRTAAAPPADASFLFLA